jgi:pyridoxine 5-phosphate synthase
MIRLSVNVNKVATLRNARGGKLPRVLDAVEACLQAGADGITVHPREDLRHITPEDVRDIARVLADRWPDAEYNIEGDPRPDFLDLVCDVRPNQCTLVPVVPGEITSQAGWTADRGLDRLPPAVERLRMHGIRVSLFVDADADSIAQAAAAGASRVELYTEPFARAFEQDAAAARASLSVYASAAEVAHAHNLGVNAGHDLDLDNLELFRRLPHLQEVSIGHALISRALFTGLEAAVREYRRVLAGGTHA